MNGFLNEDLRAVQDTARAFAEKEIVPYADQWDANHEYPEAVVKKMGSLGFFGGIIPEEYGGTNMGFLAQSVIVEEISRASGSLRVPFNCQCAGTALPISRYGSEEQKKKYIPSLISGEQAGAFAITEPNSGSDVMSMKTRAKEKNGYFSVNGSKTWISNAPIADITILYLYTDPEAGSKGLSTFIVEMDLPGISTREIAKMGIYSAPTGEIVFDEVKVPKSAILGSMGDGAKMLFSSLNQTRLIAAAGAVGLAQACLDASISYCNERSQFGRLIGTFQMNQDIIATMAVEIEAARLLTYNAAAQKDSGNLNNGRETSMAKLFSCEAASRSADSALKILSAYGYSTEYSVARHYRDSKVVQIVEGTPNIQKVIIAMDLLGYRKANR